LTLRRPRWARLFGHGYPGWHAKAELVAQAEGWVVICAPGLPMAPDAQDTATPVTVLLTRATPRMVAQYDLPDPLADPVLDQRIRSATAEAYFVKAGDYIQIIDVDGRQCTDFQCFSAQKTGPRQGFAIRWT
jgi:aminomethyltransferase